MRYVRRKNNICNVFRCLRDTLHDIQACTPNLKRRRVTATRKNKNKNMISRKTHDKRKLSCSLPPIQQSTPNETKLGSTSFKNSVVHPKNGEKYLPSDNFHSNNKNNDTTDFNSQKETKSSLLPPITIDLVPIAHELTPGVKEDSSDPDLNIGDVHINTNTSILDPGKLEPPSNKLELGGRRGSRRVTLPNIDMVRSTTKSNIDKAAKISSSLENIYWNRTRRHLFPASEEDVKQVDFQNFLMDAKIKVQMGSKLKAARYALRHNSMPCKIESDKSHRQSNLLPPISPNRRPMSLTGE